MAAIDTLRATLARINADLERLRAREVGDQARLAQTTTQITEKLAEKDAVVQAIRDLGDAWTPTP